MIKPRNQRNEAENISQNENGPVLIFTKYNNRPIALLTIDRKPVAIHTFDFDELPVGSLVSVKIADKCNNLNAVFGLLPNGEKCFLSLNDYNPSCNTTRNDGKLCEGDVIIAYVKSLKGRGKNTRITTRGVAEREDLTDLAEKVSHSLNLQVLEEGKFNFFFENITSSYDTVTVMTDLKDVYDVLIRDFAAIYSKINFYSDPDVSLNVLFKVGAAVELATERIVNLPSGGRICIDKTEALYVIDVDSGKNIKTSADELAVLTNREAMEMCAKLFVLRNMSGIVLIDLINVSDSQKRSEMIKYMRESVKNDPLNPVVKDITGLGLMELTRKKTGSSFFEEFIRQN